MSYKIIDDKGLTLKCCFHYKLAAILWLNKIKIGKKDKLYVVKE